MKTESEIHAQFMAAVLSNNQNGEIDEACEITWAVSLADAALKAWKKWWNIK